MADAVSGGARTCPGGHGRMDQYLAHDHEPRDTAQRRDCHAVWKCGTCFHQISRPFDCQMETFEASDRVRCNEFDRFDLATVREVLPDGRVVVELDQVAASGWRRPPGRRRAALMPWTLTKVARDTPMVEEEPLSKRLRTEGRWA